MKRHNWQFVEPSTTGVLHCLLFCNNASVRRAVVFFISYLRTHCRPAIFHRERPHIPEQYLRANREALAAARSKLQLKTCRSSFQKARLCTFNGGYQELFPNDLSVPDCSHRHWLMLPSAAPYRPYSSAALRVNLFHRPLEQLISTKQGLWHYHTPGQQFPHAHGRRVRADDRLMAD